MQGFWQTGIALPVFDGTRRRLGVLEDSPRTPSLLRAWLEERGEFTVTDHAQTIADAVAWLDEEELDAAVVDWFLPEGDGWALAQALKDARPELPVFIYTVDKAPIASHDGVAWLDELPLSQWPAAMVAALPTPGASD